MTVKIISPKDIYIVDYSYTELELQCALGQANNILGGAWRTHEKQKEITFLGQKHVVQPVLSAILAAGWSAHMKYEWRIIVKRPKKSLRERIFRGK